MNTNISAASGVQDESSQRRWRAVAAATIGTALEWFDLIIYGFFALTISKLFFPSDNEYVSLLIGVGSFGASYLVRPLGAIVIGHYSDRVGRKKALNATIMLMAVGTATIAFAPTYETIGIAAPILILFARLIQGFSAGGEFGAATSFLVEKAPEGERGFYASFQMAAQGATVVFAGLFGTALTTWLTPEELLAWGWRVPFIFGLLIVPVAYYIRSHVDEVPVVKESPKDKTPLMSTFADNKLRLLFAVGVYVLVTSCSYVLVIYMPTFAVKQLGISQQMAFIGTLVTGIVQFIACPLFGKLSDRIGRFRCLIAGAVALMLATYFVFYSLMNFKGLWSVILVSAAIGGLISAYQGPMPALLSEIFPKSIRTTGLALTHNLAVAIFGGFAPLIVTMGIKSTGSNWVPAFYVTAAAVLSVVSLIACRAYTRRNAV